jgi:PleD family two-component response regulator
MTERRTNHLTRNFVTEMSQKTKGRGELVCHRTGLPNRRAFDEGRVRPFVAMSDVDDLKAMNDQFGYSAGDILIRRLADLLTNVGLEAYHA